MTPPPAPPASQTPAEDAAWRALLPRLRLVDLGPGAAFGARHAVKLEGWEVLRVRPSDGKPPALHQAAALLHLIGVTPETPTWEAGEALKAAGLGPPYGRPGIDPRPLIERARALLDAG